MSKFNPGDVVELAGIRGSLRKLSGCVGEIVSFEETVVLSNGPLDMYNVRVLGHWSEYSKDGTFMIFSDEMTLAEEVAF